MSFLRGWMVALVVSVGLAAGSCGSTGTVPSTSGQGGTSVINGGGGSPSPSTWTHPASTSASGSGGQGVAPVGPPYPFVFAHGFFGFETFAGLDFETYYYKVKETLAAHGEIIETPAVDPFNDSEVRGKKLLGKVEDFLQETGASKVNIIGHSQGGLDARVVAGTRPDLVASVVTIATPHHGTPIGDIVTKMLANPNAQQIVDDLGKLLGGLLWDAAGNQTSLTKSFAQFSQPGIAAFNAKYPDAPGVFYASIAGRSALHPMGSACEADVVVPFISPWESTLDPLEALFYATEIPLAGTSNEINDGLVRAKDARWGEFWGCIPADHVNEVGQILGESPGIGNDWEYLDFYTELVAYIRQRGF